MAIDGGAASGKTMIGRQVATRMGLRFFDTGVLYRAVVYAGLLAHLDFVDGTGLVKVANELRISFQSRQLCISYRCEDITPWLFSQQVDRLVSGVAAIPQVRTALLKTQRWAITDEGKGGIVVAGRDIGTVVVPQADVKVFLIAAVKTRAQRRATARGLTFVEAEQAILQRDKRDSERKVSPLRRAKDAIIVSNDNRNPSETVAEIEQLIKATIAARK